MWNSKPVVQNGFQMENVRFQVLEISSHVFCT